MAAAPLLLAGCSPAGLVNALATNHRVARGLAYGSGPRRSLDVYAPPGPASSGPASSGSASSGSAPPGRPVVLFLYGGSWDSGDKEMYRFVGDALASRGFVVVIPDYRLYPEVRYPAFLQDCAAALAWTRQHAAHYGGSAEPPFIMGHSAGAYNAAMLTLDARWLAAHGMTPRGDLRGMVGLAGPYDFLPLDTDELRDIFAPGRPLQNTQPINHVDGRNPPVLLLAGKRDTTVRPGNTLRLAARIRSKSGFALDRLYPGIGHVEIIGAFSGPLRFLAPSLRDSASFMHAPTAALARW